MRKLLISVALFLLMPILAFSQDAVQKLSGLLQSFTTYSADFKQTTSAENGQVLQVGSGKAMIKRPGQFRWQSEKPTQQILIASGNAVWIYDVDLAQATKQSLASRTHIDPAMLLSGSVKNLAESFNVIATASAQNEIFHLTPKKSDYGFKSVTLIFSNNKLQRMLIINNLDQTTEFQFSAIQLNTQLPDSLFQFNPPKGVDVLSQ